MSPGQASVSKQKRDICEGWIEEGCDSAAVCLPELGYVQQGSKVWMAFGSQKRLDESLHIHGTTIEVVESIDKLELVERMLTNGATVRLPKDGKWIVEGPSQRSDVKNANQRVYPRKLWEKLLLDKKSYVQRLISERGMLGHLEHPKDGRTDLKESAILTLSADLREDGTVWSKFELLDTPNGRILQELTAKGVRWGVSSRGNGTVDDSGVVSESDYVLKTWDAVAAPSTPGAYARMQGLPEDVDTKNTDERAQGALAVRATASLSALKKLVESETDGLDREGRSKLCNSLLRVLETVDAPTAKSLLKTELGWQTVINAIERVRELRAENDANASIDETIERALEDGGTSDEQAGMQLVVESLQEQIATSVTENDDLRSRLQAAESSARALKEAHEEALEQLSKEREELSRTRAQRDLANELLAEATGRPDGDPLVAAKVSELIGERSGLGDYRELLCEARDVAQVVELADKLVPRAPAKVETPTPAFARRSSLPVGMVIESLERAPESRVDESTRSRAVVLAELVVPGAQKSRT